MPIPRLAATVCFKVGKSVSRLAGGDARLDEIRAGQIGDWDHRYKTLLQGGSKTYAQ